MFSATASLVSGVCVIVPVNPRSASSFVASSSGTLTRSGIVMVVGASGSSSFSAWNSRNPPTPSTSRASTMPAHSQPVRRGSSYVGGGGEATGAARGGRGQHLGAGVGGDDGGRLAA